MKRQQGLHHGPQWLKEGGVRFRLWAPTAQKVDLLLNDRAPLAMQQDSKGWTSLTVPDAKAGDLYFFRIDDRLQVPDPASHFQPQGVNGPSALFAPDFEWDDDNWQPLPWEEAVIYELHVGAFSESGDYKGVENQLDYLKSVGITAIELMPIADFEGKYGWGYDGVLPYAPHAAYGPPDDLKRLINAAHTKGMMVFLDVVYNHFGPAGNYPNEYAKSFFTDRYKTPWGSAINMEGSEEVRRFFIDNALYWLNEYNFDGLRFDAVHAIFDGSKKHFLYELAETLRQTNLAKHLILENEKNQARYLEYQDGKPSFFSAQWNDDIHHAFHVLLTGETDSYYEDFKENPLQKLGRCLAEGFAYQDDPSQHNEGKKRGEKSGHLPPLAFVSFLQNHDQIGNRALGERLTQLTDKEKLVLASSILLLAPQPPMLFMGEEWGAKTPFLYFCDFKGDLAKAVREGRRNEFKKFPAFNDPAKRDKIPDPNAASSFEASKLKWAEAAEKDHAAHLAYTTRMLELRRHYIEPLLKSGWLKADYTITAQGGLDVLWQFQSGALHMLANFSDNEIENINHGGAHIWGHVGPTLPAWKCTWYRGDSHGG